MHRQRIWMWVFGVLTLLSFFLPWLNFAGITIRIWEFEGSYLMPLMIVVALVFATLDNRAFSLGYVQLILTSFCMLIVVLYSGYNIYRFLQVIRESRTEEAAAMIEIGFGAYTSLICSILFLAGAWLFNDPENEQARRDWHRPDILDDL